MADVHNYAASAADLARVIRGEAITRLQGEGAAQRTVFDCVGAAFATSDKDRPAGPLQDTVLIVLLTEAVIKQADEIAALQKRVRELDGRTLGMVRLGDGAAPAFSGGRDPEWTAALGGGLGE